MPTRELRNLTPPVAGRPRQWRIFGENRARLCTFCGRPASATVGCPDDGAPILAK